MLCHDPSFRCTFLVGSPQYILNPRVVADLIDVTLVDEDTNAILTDNADRAIQGNVAMQITVSGCQLWN